MTKQDIERFFSAKFKTYRAQNIILRISKNRLNTLRTAFIVSSAVKKNAVARNKTRRRMNEILKFLLPNIKSGYDLVFSYKLENKKPPSFKDLKNGIIELLTLCGAL
ncbi:MAG: ribonuclease P protein component [Patescibacteria group bacterium]